MTTWFDIAGIVVAAVVGLCAWLPGVWVAGKHMGWTVPAVLAAAFAVAPLTTAASAIIAWAMHSSLWLVVALTILQAVVFTLLAVRSRERVVMSAIRPGVQGIVIGLLAGGLAFWERPWFGLTADTFYHLAAARSLLATGAPLVTDPLYKSGTTVLDPTSGIFHTWLAVSSRVSNVQVEYVYAGFTALAAGAVVWSFWALAERVSGSQTSATLATVGFVALGLMGDLRPAGMPNRFTVALLCITLLAIYETTASEKRWPAAVVAGVAMVSTLLTHIAAAGALLLFAAAVIVSAVLFGRRFRQRRFLGPALLAFLVSILVALPIMWPRLTTALGSPMTDAPESLPSAFISLGAGMVMIKPGAYVGGGAVAFVLMTLIALIAAYRGYRDRDGGTLTLAAFLAVPAVFMCFPPVTTLAAAISPYTVARVALMLGFVPFLAAAWALGVGITAWRKEPRSASAAVILLLGTTLLIAHTFATWQLTQVTFVEVPGRMRNGEAYTVAQSKAADIRNSWGIAALKDARAVFGDDYPIVAASPETGYYLAGLANVAIVAAPDSHSPLAIETIDGPQRRDDMARLLNPATTETERRVILAARGAEYVALSLTGDEDILAWESMQEQTYLFEPVVQSRRLVILRVLD